MERAGLLESWWDDADLATAEAARDGVAYRATLAGARALDRQGVEDKEK